MNISIDHLKQIYINTFECVVFDEHSGIEMLVKINRVIHEYLHLKDKANGLFVELDAYCNKKYCAVLDDNGILFKSNHGTLIINKNDVLLIKDEICRFLSDNYGLNIINFFKIDPMFLEQVLGVDLPYLIKAEIKNIRLKKLRNFSLNHDEGLPLYEGRYYKQIVLNKFTNYPRHKNNFIGQTNEDRILKSVSNMKGNRYSCDGSFITLYNQSFVIRDGEHRAAALLYLYNDIEIPVLILSFSKNYYSYKLFYEGDGK